MATNVGMLQTKYQGSVGLDVSDKVIYVFLISLCKTCELTLRVGSFLAPVP